MWNWLTSLPETLQGAFFGVLGGVDVELNSSLLTGALGALTGSAVGMLGDTFWSLLASTLGLLPNGGTFPQTVHDAANGLGALLRNIDFIFPVYDLILILVLAVTIKFVLFALRLITWAIGLIRGGGGYMPI